MAAIKHVILNKTIGLQLIMTLTECDNHNNRGANKKLCTRGETWKMNLVLSQRVSELYGYEAACMEGRR